jgi:hypothetical protein
VLSDERVVAERHRQAFGSTGCNGQSPDSLATDRSVSEGSDRERPTNRITNAAGTPALTREGLFTHVLQQSVGLVQDMPILGYTDERKRSAREGGISV